MTKDELELKIVELDKNKDNLIFIKRGCIENKELAKLATKHNLVFIIVNDVHDIRKEEYAELVTYLKKREGSKYGCI